MSLRQSLESVENHVPREVAQPPVGAGPAVPERLRAAWGTVTTLPGWADDLVGSITLDDVLDHVTSPLFLQRNLVLLREQSKAGNHAARDRADVLGSLRAGSSIQVRELQAFLPRSHPVVVLGEQVEATLGVPLDSITLFVTPPGQQALPRHTDATDVVAVQLAGRKHWQAGDRSFELAAGDAACIPAGTPHEVRDAGTELSVSLAYAIRPMLWQEAVRRRVDAVLEALPAPPTPLLSGGPRALGEQQAVRSYLESVLRALSDGSAYCEALHSTALDRRLPPRDPADLDPAPERVRRTGAEAWVDADGAAVRVRVAGGGRFEAPVELSPAVHLLLDPDADVEVTEVVDLVGTARATRLLGELRDLGLLEVVR